MDSISAMRYGMEQSLRDLKWMERFVKAGGVTEYLSLGDSVSCEIAPTGTNFAFGYDDGEGDGLDYKTFAAGDTWKEFERALYLAQAIEEEKIGTRQDLIGKWWDSCDRVGRREWFRAHGCTGQSTVFYDCAWRALVGHERENIEREVLKGITK